MSLQKPHWRYAVIIFFVGIFIAHAAHAIFLSYRFTPDPWLTGDWLINYQGGFVRRGLAGEVFFRVAQFTGADPVLLIVGFQILMYSILLVNTYRLAVHSSLSPVTTAIIFSPAFVVFTALDPQGGFRKEIIFLAIYSALASHLVFSKKIHGYLPLLLGIASILLIPSHEMLAVYLPYLICPIILYEKGLGVMAKKTALAILPSLLVAVLLAIFSKPGADTVAMICNSLATAPRDCSNPEVQGAISFLKQDLVTAHQFVLNSINREAIIIYVITATLSFLPMALAFFDRQNASLQHKQTRFWLAVCILPAILGSLPLLWIAADYGRLIHIHISCLSLLALTARQDESVATMRRDFKQAIAWAIVIAYVSSWRLIHWNPDYGFAFPLAKLFLQGFFFR
jgi:hypothetical protein